MESTNVVTVRLETNLHRKAVAVAKLSGMTLRALIEHGIQSEIKERMRDGNLLKMFAEETG